MAEHGGDADDRTEAPTQRRLQRARDEGEAPVSREAVMLAGLAAAALALGLGQAPLGRRLAVGLSGFLRLPATPDDDLSGFIWAAGRAGLEAVAPLALTVLAAAIAATFAQTRFAMKPWRPGLRHLSVGTGLRRVLGRDSLIELVRSLAKLILAGTALQAVLRPELFALPALLTAPAFVLGGRLARVAVHLVLAAAVAQTVVVGADLLWLWRQHQRRLRMSRSDIRDEQKETEGDPAVRLRLRRLRLRRARQRMLARVKTATVVVTNPTHYAAALAYDAQPGSVPRLVAKGVDSLALRIRHEAAAHGVPVVADPPLARTLWQLPLDTRIPPELYKVVAELIAYVWRISGRTGR